MTPLRQALGIVVAFELFGFAWMTLAGSSGGAPVEVQEQGPARGSTLECAGGAQHFRRDTIRRSK